MPDQTFKRRVAKFAARHAVWAGTASLIEAATHQIVDVEDDSIENTGIEIGATVVGFAVMVKCEKYTDRMVDGVADWRIARKAKKAQQS